MKHLSMMAGLMALSISPLFAQEAATVLPVPTPAVTPATMTAPIVIATTPDQAKPSPEFRSYVRLLLANSLSELSTSIATLSTFEINNQEDMAKNADAIALIVSKAFVSTSSAALTGEDKAFVDEVSTLISGLFVAYKATDMEDEDAVKKLQMQAMMPMMMLSQKYPKVLSYFDGSDSMNNFFDVKKVEAYGKKIEPEMSKLRKLSGDAEIMPAVAKIAGQVAEMIRKNEI